MTDTPTPTQEAMAKSVATYDVKDATGRVITIRKPTIIAQYRFIDMLGPSRSANSTYVNMTMPALFVIAIDGESVITPSTHKELEALIQRLDDAGIAAIVAGILEHYGEQSLPEDMQGALKK